MAETETKTQIIQVGAVFATDQDRALEFYLDKLGFEKRTDHARGRPRAANVLLPRSGWR